MRETETLYRIGGDEFCVLLPEVSSTSDVSRLIDRIKEQISETSVDTLNIEIGCSIGVALYPQDGDRLELLMSYADQDMYRAKSE